MFAFRAMNTDVAVTAASADEEAVASRVAATFWQAERRFSRFRADSELSRLHRARGPAVVSAELFAILARARAYTEMTGGLFDPAVGGALAALGYDRSFARGALDRARAAPRPRAGSFLDVVLDPSTRVVERPEHLQIDLGGMVKGATVDAAAAHLRGAGAIDAGGDAILCGRDPAGEDWLVDVEDPVDASRTIATLAVSDGAVATSAANRRCWRVGDAVAHHLIDPRTQASAMTDLAQATVIAPRVELAEVLAKTAFLLGARAGRSFLERQPGVGAVLVRRGGGALFVGAIDVREVNHD
jgi:thiamine biosynthesis lipoprotein